MSANLRERQSWKSMLCVPCLRIFRFQRKAIENEREPGYVKDTRVGQDTLFYEHHTDLAYFRSSVTDKCRLCKLVWDCVPSETRIEIYRPYDIEEAIIPSYYSHTYGTSYYIGPSASNPDGWTIFFQLPRPVEGQTQNGKMYFSPVREYENVPIELIRRNGLATHSSQF